jgi:hypothetical protein
VYGTDKRAPQSHALQFGRRRRKRRRREEEVTLQDQLFWENK